MSVLIHPVTPFCKWQEILRPPIARRSFIEPIYKDMSTQIQIKIQIQIKTQTQIKIKIGIQIQI